VVGLGVPTERNDMDVLNALVINKVTFPVVNDTDYYLDEYLYSDYGFELFYNKRRGMNQIKWEKLLDSNGFGVSAPNRTRAYGGHYYSAETHVRTLNFREFMDRAFVVHWVSGGTWYALAFDTREFVVQDNHQNYWLPDLVL
jgi:hypothetical protein